MRFDSIEKYSIFAINNLNMKNADCEGNMAVGKNITLENFSIGIGYAPTSSNQFSNTLVIGGTVNIKNCVNYSGNTVVQKNKYPKNYKMSTPKGSIILKKVFDFLDCHQYLSELSSCLKVKNSNALVEKLGEGRYELMSVFKNEIQIFNLDSLGEYLEELNIYFMVDNKSPIIVNVNCEKISLENIKVYFNNQLCTDSFCTRILWNFYNAKEITIKDSKFFGTIFAPNSVLNIKNSVVYGSVYGYDIFGDSDVLLCKLDIGLCRYLNDIQNYSFENINSKNVKLKNKFTDPYYAQTNTVVSSNSITKQSISQSSTNSITKTKTNISKNNIQSNSIPITNVMQVNNLSTKANSKEDLIDIVDKKDSSKVDIKLIKKSTELNKIYNINESEIIIKNITIDSNNNNKNKNIKTKKNRKVKNKYNQDTFLNILNSIAREEEGISEILRAEAFKIKKAVEMADTVEDYIKLDESLSKTVRGLDSLQSLLIYKFEEVLKMYNKG